VLGRQRVRYLLLFLPIELLLRLPGDVNLDGQRRRRRRRRRYLFNCCLRLRRRRRCLLTRLFGDRQSDGGGGGGRRSHRFTTAISWRAVTKTTAAAGGPGEGVRPTAVKVLPLGRSWIAFFSSPPPSRLLLSVDNSTPCLPLFFSHSSQERRRHKGSFIWYTTIAQFPFW